MCVVWLNGQNPSLSSSIEIQNRLCTSRPQPELVTTETSFVTRRHHDLYTVCAPRFFSPHTPHCDLTLLPLLSSFTSLRAYIAGSVQLSDGRIGDTSTLRSLSTSTVGETMLDINPARKSLPPPPLPPPLGGGRGGSDGAAPAPR